MGKPIDFSKYVLGGFYYDVDGKIKYYTYEIGKDCRINQYTTKINYDTISTEQLKWKSGMPTEKGEYVIRIEGIGSVVGYKDVVITVENTFDPEYIDINDLKASKQEIELDGKNIFVYAMRAKSAGDYAVFVKCMNSSFSVNMALFDSFGNEIEEKNTGYNGYVTSSVCSMVTLETGQVCYICLGGYFLPSESADNDKAKAQISVFGEEIQKPTRKLLPRRNHLKKERNLRLRSLHIRLLFQRRGTIRFHLLQTKIRMLRK